MFSRHLVWCTALLASSAFACNAQIVRCRPDEQLAELVNYRSQAIETAFGAFAAPMPSEVRVEFVSSSDPRFDPAMSPVALDLSQRTMAFARRALSAKIPSPLTWAKSYWPYYQDPQYTAAFPIIAAIDSALWSAYLQEAAHQHGFAWPHVECGSIDLGKRLPCEMLVDGVLEYITTPHVTLFNENRIEEIWPSDMADFRQRLWRRNDREYDEVRHLGGILLLRPLIAEFGVQRALVYVAQHPFILHNENLRMSALSYQDAAREILRRHEELAQR
jgi:hypothetical protein